MRNFDDFDIGPQSDERYDADYPFDPSYEEDDNSYACSYSCKYDDDVLY